MRELERPVARVWRLLRFQRFLSAMVWCSAAALLVAAALIGVERLGSVALPGPDWLPFAIAGALAAIAAGLIAASSGKTLVDAAVAIDHAFDLNERISTALTLPVDLRETPAGRALVQDAIRHAANLDVGTRFRPSLPRRVWLPLLPAALGIALIFAPTRVTRNALATPATAADQQRVAKQSQALGKKIASQRKDLEKDKLSAEADKLLAAIEKAAENLAKAPPAQKDKALIELNKLTDAVKDRQRQIGSQEQVERQLRQLKEMSSNGPADDFGKALAKGDFQKAAEELKTLQQKLQSGKLTEPETKALKEQLGEMTKQLAKLANLDERRKMLEEAKKNGGLSKEQFDKEMAKLEDQTKALKQLQQVAAKLERAQEALAKGDMKKAASELGATEKQLSEMAAQLNELQALDDALADLQDAKNGMNADGVNQLGEDVAGAGMNEYSRRRQGNSLGRGRGQGDRPEAPDATASYTSKVKQQFKKGKAVVEGFSRTNSALKGQSVIDIQGEVDAADGASADALTNQKIPRSVEKHVRGYFDQINKGK